MIAISRWNEFNVNATTGYTSAQVGTKGYVKATNQTGTDSFTITGSTNNLRVTIGSDTRTVVLCSGVELDPRFVALDIQRKLQEQYAYVSNTYQSAWQNAKCEWENGHFVIYGGNIINSMTVDVASTSNDARSTLGFDTRSAVAASTGTNGYTGTCTVTGTYTGQYDDIYTLIATDSSNYNTPSITGGTFSLGTGGITLGGAWNLNQTRTYTVHIDTTNGSTMGAGAGLVPVMTWENDNHSDDSVSGVDLLFPDYWYDVGANGFRIKFGDGVFDGTGNGNMVDIEFTTNAVDTVSTASSSSPVGTAKFIVRSRRGDDMAPQATSQTPIAFGTQGLSVSWTATDNIDAGDSWVIFARSIAPTSGDAGITTVNFGNVTVSTDSAVKVVQFEIMSGAVIMDSLKFGLNSNGGFQHHNAGDNDTFVHFATVGAANPDDSGNEWNSGVSSTNLSPSPDKDGNTTGTPENLWSAVKNLSVVSSADDSEPVGNVGLSSDYIFLGIKLGASETSANTVTYRIFYDFS